LNIKADEKYSRRQLIRVKSTGKYNSSQQKHVFIHICTLPSSNTSYKINSRVNENYYLEYIYICNQQYGVESSPV